MWILADYLVGRDLTFTIGEHRFGFMDANHTFAGDVTVMFLGPLGGFYKVPFSAVQGWTIVAISFAALLTCVVCLCLRRRNRRDESSGE